MDRHARLQRFRDLLNDVFAFAASVFLLLVIPRLLELLDAILRRWRWRHRPLPKSR